MSLPQHRYRMIAIDLDGTLLSPHGQVSERSRSAVHRCLAEGLLVCFATGRNWTESRPILDAVAHYGTAVFVGGAMVVDTRQEVTLHRTLMDPELAVQICRFLEDNGHAVLALQDTDAAGVDYLVTDKITLNGETEKWMHATQAKVHRVPSLADYPHEHTIRVGIVAEHHECERVHRELDRRFAERIFLQSIRVPAAGVDVLEVFDPSVNKWEGILHVARRHGIEPEQIVAIGDDVNDIHMISRAGLGVAMGNARPEIQKLARRVIRTNGEDGLALFLEELLDGHIVEPLKSTGQDNTAGEAA